MSASPFIFNRIQCDVSYKTKRRLFDVLFKYFFAEKQIIVHQNGKNSLSITLNTMLVSVYALSLRLK